MLAPSTMYWHQRIAGNVAFWIVAQELGSGMLKVVWTVVLPFIRAFLSLNSRACEMADEFPHVQVVGVDVAPIQPEYIHFYAQQLYPKTDFQ